MSQLLSINGHIQMLDVLGTSVYKKIDVINNAEPLWLSVYFHFSLSRCFERSLFPFVSDTALHSQQYFNEVLSCLACPSMCLLMRVQNKPLFNF